MKIDLDRKRGAAAAELPFDGRSRGDSGHDAGHTAVGCLGCVMRLTGAGDVTPRGDTRGRPLVRPKVAAFCPLLYPR
jgi:hypothetical protein